jgi:hypothetical protein
MHSASNSWYKCFISSCTCSLYDNKLFVMLVGMRIIVVDQQFNLVPNVWSSSTLNKLLEVWISTSLFFHWIKFCFFQFSYTTCVLCGLCYCCIVGGCCTNGFVVTHRQLLINLGTQVWFYCVWLVCIWVGLQWARSLNTKVQNPQIHLLFSFFCNFFHLVSLCPNTKQPRSPINHLQNENERHVSYISIYLIAIQSLMRYNVLPTHLSYAALDCHLILSA